MINRKVLFYDSSNNQSEGVIRDKYRELNKDYYLLELPHSPTENALIIGVPCGRIEYIIEEPKESN